jgi:hypothetical protein
MKANMKNGLPLRLVNSHGISQPQRKLLPCKCKWQTIVIEMNLMRGIKATLPTPLHVMISMTRSQVTG